MKRKRGQHGPWSLSFAKRSLLNLSKGLFLIAIWPIWVYFEKSRCEYRYLTSHGEDRVKQRKKFLKNNITSSRAQIIEICSEATFQPLLQLYLLLPKLMCVDYHDLFEQDLYNFFSDVPRLQFWAIFTSCMSLSWSFNAYQTSKKTGALDFEANLGGRLVLLASCVCLITSRLFVFVFLAYCFGDGQFYPMVVLVVSHMLLMTAFHWLTTDPKAFNIKKNFAFVTNKCLLHHSQVFYQCLLNGISNIYLYNDILALPRDDEKKEKEEKNEKNATEQNENKVLALVKEWKQIIVDVIFVLESLVIVSTSVYLVDGLPIPLVVGVVILHALGLTLKAVYYKSLHIWSDLTRMPNLKEHCLIDC